MGILVRFVGVGIVPIKLSSPEIKNLTNYRSYFVKNDNVFKAATDFLVAARSVRCDDGAVLVDNARLLEQRNLQSYSYLVDFDTITGRFSVYQITKGVIGTTTYMSSYEQFEAFANQPVNPLKGYEGKLIRFTYNGGTTPGVRIVRLDSVSGSGLSTILKGTDMAHALDPKAEDKGFRSYAIGKISGKIEVLN